MTYDYESDYSSSDDEMYGGASAPMVGGGSKTKSKSKTGSKKTASKKRVSKKVKKSKRGSTRGSKSRSPKSAYHKFMKKELDLYFGKNKGAQPKMAFKHAVSEWKEHKKTHELH